MELSVGEVAAVVAGLVTVCGFLGAVAAAGWRAGTWLQRLRSAVDSFGAKLAELATTVSSLVSSHEATRSSVGQLDRRCDGLEERVDRLEGRVDGLSDAEADRIAGGG